MVKEFLQWMTNQAMAIGLLINCSISLPFVNLNLGNNSNSDWSYGGVWSETICSMCLTGWHKRSGSPFLCALLYYPFNSSVGSYDAFVLFLIAIQL